MKKKEMKYPECEKLAAVSEKSQKCGEFLNWLVAGEYVELNTHKSTEDLLARFFGIDMVKVEKERQAMLEELRK